MREGRTAAAASCRARCWGAAARTKTQRSPRVRGQEVQLPPVHQQLRSAHIHAVVILHVWTRTGMQELTHQQLSCILVWAWLHTWAFEKFREKKKIN